MSHGPSTFGTMITSSLWPISPTTCVRSSSTHGDSSELTRVQSWVSPSSMSLPTVIRPSRAASLRSTGTASSRLPSRMSTVGAMSGTLATIFSLEKSRKWIIRDGRTGISRTGSGASIASGLRKSRGLRMTGTLIGTELVGVHVPGHRAILPRVRRAALVFGLAWLAVAAPATAATVKRTGARAYTVTISGAPQSDLTIARLDFRLGAYSRHPTRRSLRVSVAGSTGLNYLAAGRLLPVGPRTLTALVALVNRRPPGSLAPDLAFVRVHVAGARLTHRPRVSEVVGAFARRARAAALGPALCVHTPRT